MKFIDKLERKFGRFGIPNLTIYMIVCYVIGYALLIIKMKWGGIFFGNFLYLLQCYKRCLFHNSFSSFVKYSTRCA